MSILRAYDRVVVMPCTTSNPEGYPTPGEIGRVYSVDDGRVTVQLEPRVQGRALRHLYPFNDDELELLCEDYETAPAGDVGSSRYKPGRLCHLTACGFASDGRALCEIHGRMREVQLFDTRPDELAIAVCSCGETLDAAAELGIWTIGGIACTYVRCWHCEQSRPFMPRDVVKGREVGLFADPDTSEIYADEKRIYASDSFLEALRWSPPNDRATLMRNGVVLARVYTYTMLTKPPIPCRGWHVCEPLRETPARM